MPLLLLRRSLARSPPSFARCRGADVVCISVDAASNNTTPAAEAAAPPPLDGAAASACRASACRASACRAAAASPAPRRGGRLPERLRRRQSSVCSRTPEDWPAPAVDAGESKSVFLACLRL